ncbi:hypothetical protein FJTKL_12432 [Diaporthe vaccinii]|uniref:Serine/threonine specific protein phosphatases domain-containing protein n=1 Tax=Diaporthe vaccinii TaxID=105482 RepID=A0ABR4EDS9_9PEZI
MSDMRAYDIIAALVPDLPANPTVPLELQHSTVTLLLEESRKTLELGENINSVSLNGRTRIILVGDLHGNIDNLCAIISAEGRPSKSVIYVFNGDFVDRDFVFLNRGNHESDLARKERSLLKELHHRFGEAAEAVYERCLQAFRAMQIAAVISSASKKAFIVHGGIPVSGPKPILLKNITDLNRHLDPPKMAFDHFTQLLWNDPKDHSSSMETHRDGYGQLFNRDDTRAFLEANEFDMVFRSHQMIAEGLREDHQGCFTVFSALDGHAQYVVIRNDLEKELKIVDVGLREEQWRYLS